VNFPLRVGDQVLHSAPELGALARADCRDGGGVVPGRRVWQWVLQLVLQGTVDRGSAAALAAGLIRIPDAATIAEGARLAGALAEPAVADLLIAALGRHDTGLLLQPDPGDPGSSVEDTVLRSIVVVADLADPVLRRDILERLRNAALRAEETAVLCKWGDTHEISTWMPAILTEGVPAAARGEVESRAAKSDAGSAVLRSLVPEADRPRTR
jgi:hypothetical protein